jgi:hypothetical protein
MRLRNRFAILLIAVVAGVVAYAPRPALAQAGSVDVRVAAGADDAEEDSMGAVVLTDPVLDLGGPYRSVGLRFAGIDIPKYSKITRAYIEFATAASDAATTNFTIEVQGSSAVSPFTTAFGDISGRNVYNQKVEWKVDYAWETVDQVRQSADISTLVQWMVNRVDWDSGDSMGFIIRSKTNENVYRRAVSWNADAAKAPLLHIEYTDCAIDVRVSSSTDDMCQYYPMGGTSFNTDTVSLGYNTTYLYTGFRFQNVNIPQGSTINNAYLILTPKQSYASGSLMVYMYGMKSVNRPTFSTDVASTDSVYNQYLHTKTTQVMWTTHAAATADQPHSSPSIKNVIQQIVGLSNWNISSKALMLILRSNTSATFKRDFHAFDSDPAKAPLLRIEYTPPPPSGGAPFVSLSTAEIGRSCFEGTAAENQTFSLSNTGSGQLRYTVQTTYHSGSDWMSLTPNVIGEGTVDPGEEQPFTVRFNTAGLAVGTYEGTIKITNKYDNSTRTIRVALQVIRDGVLKCGDVPLYTKNMISPAVLVLLDLSSSMNWEIDVIPENYDFTASTSPNIKGVVQELVNRDGWKPGNAMAFFLENAGGSGYRHARAFDGYSGSAPLLLVEYAAGGGPQNLDVRVSKSSDDGAAYSPFTFNDTENNIKMAQAGSGWAGAVRFENLTIPKGAVITNAYIRFTPGKTDSDAITLKISGQASDNPPTFVGGASLLIIPKTVASVNWSVPPWTSVIVERKIDIAKSVISELVKDKGIAWGFGTWANEPPWDGLTESPKTYTLIDVGCRPYSADQQARLQAAIAGVGTYDSTPFSPSILGAARYFAGLKKDNDPAKAGLEDGAFFTESTCQPKFLIQVTDGLGNVDSTVDNVRERTNALADAGVSAVGIGFGLAESETAQLYAYADVANTRGKASTSDSLYALHPEDNYNKAVPYMAFNKDQLMNAFRAIMSNVKGAVFYGSAPAATTSTEQGDIALLASFDAANWTGELQAIQKAADGRWSSVLWQATDKMPATADRKAYTVNDANQVVPYDGATLAGDNYLCKKLGDIVNSTPIVVGPPPFFYTFDNYAAFKISLGITEGTKRDPVVYVGSNDGLLHAFDLNTGKEKWAFLPKNLQARLDQAASNSSFDMCSTDFCRQSFLDGSPQAADVYAKFGAAGKQWRTMLVVGQREGGSHYTALDVTSGKGFGDGTDPAKYLWEFADPDLGETWADVQIERVRDLYGGANSTAWGVYFSSGYAENDNQQPDKSSYLYGIEADTGGKLWYIRGNEEQDLNPPNANKILINSGGRCGILNLGTYSIGGWPNTFAFQKGEVVTGLTTGTTATVDFHNVGPYQLGLTNVKGHFWHGEKLSGSLGHKAWAQGFLWEVSPALAASYGLTPPIGFGGDALNSPIVVDTDMDRKADRIYVGNLYGTLYRVTNIGMGETPKVGKLFDFEPVLTSPDKKPIRGQANIAYSATAGEVWVYFGTGRYESDADKDSTEQQYFFGLKDAATPEATYNQLGLAKMAVVPVTASVNGKSVTVRTVSGTNPGALPWSLALAPGQTTGGKTAGSERAFTKPLIAGGIVLFTSFIPDADQCTGDGDTWIYALDFKTGLPPARPVFDLNGDGKFTDADKVEVNGQKVVPVGIHIGRGVGSKPVLFKSTIFVTTTNANLAQNAEGANVGGLHSFPVNIPESKVRVESWKNN